MATKLKDLIGKIGGVDLEFIDMIVDETQRDSQKIVRLVLKAPLDQVIGRRMNDGATGDSVNLTAFDVQMVTLNPEAINEIEKLEDEGKSVFEWVEEGKSGRLKTDQLKLDVSRAQEVWVVKTSLAAWGRQQQNDRRSKQTASLAERIRERQTKKEFGNTPVNTNVGTGAAATATATPTPVVTKS